MRGILHDAREVVGATDKRIIYIVLNNEISLKGMGQ